MNKSLDVVEDAKQSITDKQYKTIMESLMEINEINKLPLLHENQRNKFVCLFILFDKKLEITEYKSNSITRRELLDYYFRVIVQDCSYEYQYVKYLYDI
jgi:hypothetical protein